jgi:hypothetical protein
MPAGTVTGTWARGPAAWGSVEAVGTAVGGWAVGG